MGEKFATKYDAIIDFCQRSLKRDLYETEKQALKKWIDAGNLLYLSDKCFYEGDESIAQMYIDNALMEEGE